MTFGDRLRMVRTARKLSQIALADAAGISKPTLSYVETGRREPQETTRQVLAEALEVPREALEDDVECFRALAQILGVAVELTPLSPMGTNVGVRDGLFAKDQGQESGPSAMGVNVGVRDGLFASDQAPQPATSTEPPAEPGKKPKPIAEVILEELRQQRKRIDELEAELHGRSDAPRKTAPNHDPPSSDPGTG